MPARKHDRTLSGSEARMRFRLFADLLQAYCAIRNSTTPCPGMRAS